MQKKIHLKLFVYGDLSKHSLIASRKRQLHMQKEELIKQNTIYIYIKNISLLKYCRQMHTHMKNNVIKFKR